MYFAVTRSPVTSKANARLQSKLSAIFCNLSATVLSESQESFLVSFGI